MKKRISIPVDRPKINVLNKEKIQQIHDASLEILQKVGVKVLQPDARDLLAIAGAEVINDELVKIPPRIVEECLDMAPSSISVYDRDGNPAMLLEAQNIYFGTGCTIQFVWDIETGERRETTMGDIESVARIVDYLPNIDFVMHMGMTGGVDATSIGLNSKVTDRYDFAAILRNTTKPLAFSCWSAEGLADCYEMALACREGREKAFAEKPFILHYCEPTTPLIQAKDPLEELLFCAEKSIPVIHVSALVQGGTAPATVAGCLVLSNAEFLSGLVIGQLKKKGAPMIYGGGASPLDMRTGVNLYSGPEFILNHIALKEMAEFYQLPDFNTAGATDSKMLDQQAAADYALSIFQAAIVGSNVIHDVGYMESGYTASWEGIVLADEIIDYMKILLKGIPVNDDTLALDVIMKQGPGGNFISDKHTFEHFREVWYPKLMDRNNYSNWVKEGAKDLKSKLNSKVKEILTNHKPKPLGATIASQVDTILERAKEKYPVQLAQTE